MCPLKREQARREMQQWVMRRLLTADSIVEIGRKRRSWISVHSPIMLYTKLDADCNQQVTVVSQLLITHATMVDVPLHNFSESKIREKLTGKVPYFSNYPNFLKDHVGWVEANLYAKNQLDLYSCLDVILACDRHRGP